MTVTALVFLSFALGCNTTQRVSERVSEKVTHAVETAATWDNPAPATQAVCFWQRRLALLPDPTRDGVQASGLVGQVFLVTADSQTAEVAGDITVSVYDETPRPAGMPAKAHEVFHFDKATLKKLVAGDERFGRSHVLFLPWRKEWADVSTVRILARYDVPGQPTIFAEQMQLTLDLGGNGPVWTDATGNPVTPSGGDSKNVPDGRKLAEQAKGKTTPVSNPVVPASATSPVTSPIAPPAMISPIIVPSGP